MHDNQLDISPDVARALIGRQFPQWRSLPVRPVAAAGTVNAIFLVGDRYAARFPLEAGDAEAVRRSLEAEAAAAAELAGRTRFRTPEPIIGVRDGRFCAHPLLARFAADGVTADGAGVRASLGLGSRAEDVDRLLAALASLRAHGPAWTYAGPEAGHVPDPDPRALPDWLASAVPGPAAPCGG